jgi:UDP:flavonoid glycosyltransferase YjiC (YdhE family)
MRVRVVTVGSQGDVRPYVAFGSGLRRAGYDVRVATHPAFEPLVRGAGLDFAPVAGDPREQEDDERLRALHDDGRNALRWWKTFRDVDAPLMRRRLQDCRDACGDADVLVTSVLPYPLAWAIARKQDVPLVRAFYFPVSPTRAHPPDIVPSWLRLGGRSNLAAYALQRHVLWQIARPFLARACRDVLGPMRLPLREPFGDLDRQRRLLLYCYSPAVAPPPPDWGGWQEVTGYWFLDRPAEWSPPPALARFLEDGPAPVYVGGFGHMTNRDPGDLARTVLHALARAGQRAVVLSGWGGLRPGDLPPEVCAVDWVPYDWLFSRVAAVVHHGGAGTTAAGLRAGVPTVVVPFFLDQFFWGRRVYALGVGPRPLPRRRLNAEALAGAIRTAATDPGMRARAAVLGARIRAEDGVARAVDAFTRHLGRPPAFEARPA